jgi:hypothetical protein
MIVMQPLEGFRGPPRSRWHFAQCVGIFDDLIDCARKGKLSPDDFQGTTISLTNSGTVGAAAPLRSHL